jgi:hypothetical protein
MWLATVHKSKAKASVRPKLLEFLKEAKQIASALSIGASPGAAVLAAEIVAALKRLVLLR